MGMLFQTSPKFVTKVTNFLSVIIVEKRLSKQHGVSLQSPGVVFTTLHFLHNTLAYMSCGLYYKHIFMIVSEDCQ